MPTTYLQIKYLVDVMKSDIEIFVILARDSITHHDFR